MGKIEALLSRLRGHRVYIDANFFIYFFNGHPDYFNIVAPILQSADEGSFGAICGDAVISEVMVHPYKHHSPADIAHTKQFFDRSGFITVVSHDAKTFDLTAQLRASTSMRMLDALHYATAVNAGCRFMLSNDRDFKTSGSLEVIGISSLI